MDSPVSSAVSSEGFDEYTDLRMTLHTRLDRYTEVNPQDDTARFLKTFFSHLPQGGQSHLVEDVSACSDDEELRQLVESIETGLLRPMRALGGRTPCVRLPPRLENNPHHETLTPDPRSAAESAQRELRKNCMQRDGNRCVLTGFWDSDYPNIPGESNHVLTECAHIIPSTMAQSGKMEDFKLGMVWDILHRFFPSLIDIGFDSSSVNSEENAMMLADFLHTQFGRFQLVLEPTTTNQYKIKTFPRFPPVFLGMLPRDRIIELSQSHASFPPPDRNLLAVHAAIGKILHLTGRGKEVETLKHGLDGSGLMPDGSTDIASLLSVSSLLPFIKKSNDPRIPIREKKRQEFRDQL